MERLEYDLLFRLLRGWLMAKVPTFAKHWLIA